LVNIRQSFRKDEINENHDLIVKIAKHKKKFGDLQHFIPVPKNVLEFEYWEKKLAGTIDEFENLTFAAKG
jgi:hypothetical protein